MQWQHCINIYRLLLADFLECVTVVLSLVSTACVVSVWLLWVTIGQAEDTGVTVEIASLPSLEHLRPPTDLAHVTLTALLHGTPLSQGHMKVQLTAPPRTTVLATDYPRVAGTPLLAFDSDFIDGRVTLQYRFPLRGAYTFDLEMTPVPGGPVFPPTSRRQTVRIAEDPVMIRHTWLLVVGLFVLGVITGASSPAMQPLGQSGGAAPSFCRGSGAFPGWHPIWPCLAIAPAPCWPPD